MGRRIVFDVETPMIMEGEDEHNKYEFHQNVKGIACICAVDVDTDEQFTYHDNKDNEVSDGSIIDGLRFLLEAEVLIGHNIKRFDIAAIVKIYPKLENKFALVRQFDTLVASRQMYTWKELQDSDAKHSVAHSEYASRSPHGLAAWGNRFRDAMGLTNLVKDAEFAANVDWGKIIADADLVEYCMKDVLVNQKIYDVLLKRKARLDAKAPPPFE